ncbi:hypothetical protein [Oceanibaculum pacificum]|uniref:Uncharacterized protein n=1 Tax=Oceanibaculum pacificum TaxID=580166 RepID=A0A154W4F9_9PROT|nr:hypothetical protein [Oceanibaculum pacificum]KZD08331.1 hypothetical protein AUP43_01640 [Oceanibaculum pacificum]
MRRLLLIVGTLMALSACTAAQEQAPVWLGGTPRDAEAQMVEEVPVYCYHSLARPECYSHPLPPKETSRLVSYFGPPPQSLDATGPTRP